MGKENKTKHFALDIHDNRATIDIDGEIGFWEWDEEKQRYTKISGKKIRQQLDRLAEADVRNITVRINSLGGIVDDALAIHDALKEHKARVTTVITGFCASAATVIAMAGDERLISPTALMLIHKCWSMGYGNENELEEQLDAQRKTNEVIKRTYREHWKGTEEELDALMDANYGHGKWLTSEEAIKYGLCTGENKPEKNAQKAQASIMAMLGLPELPQKKEEESLLQKIRNVFSTATEAAEEAEEPATEESNEETGNEAEPDNQTQTQNQEQMKKFASTFALLAAMLTAQADKEYDPAKGVTLTEDELSAIETRLKALENAKTQLETAKAQAEQERDNWKNKYENLPARDEAKPSEDPKTGKGATVADYVKEDPFYKAVAENEGFEL